MMVVDDDDGRWHDGRWWQVMMVGNDGVDDGVDGWWCQDDGVKMMVSPNNVDDPCLC